VLPPELPRGGRAVDTGSIRRWFDSYLTDFVALGAGEVDDVTRMLQHYAVPMLLSTEAGCTLLADEAQVLAAVRAQTVQMRSAGYHRSEELEAETTMLNPSCAVHRGRFARLRADGTEINRLEATYLITALPVGLRISALVVHSAP
jgi:hypothetical protein